MSFFGVTATFDATFTAGLGSFFRPTPIWASDGRFTVSPRDGRDRDLIIAGPGFERRTVRAVPLDQGDIGDIEVVRGHRIEGVVRDDSGHPVPNATVTFSPSTSAAYGAAREDVDQLTELLRGIIAVTADEHGHYVIDGAAPDDLASPTTFGEAPMRISARSPDHASVPLAVPDADATMDLTLLQSGFLELVAPGRAPKEFISIDMRAVAAPDVSLRFSINDIEKRLRVEIPVGDYDMLIWLHGRGYTKHRISITAHQSTKVVAE